MKCSCNGKKLKEIGEGGEAVSVVKCLNVETLINNTIHSKGYRKENIGKENFQEYIWYTRPIQGNYQNVLRRKQIFPMCIFILTLDIRKSDNTIRK